MEAHLTIFITVPTQRPIVLQSQRPLFSLFFRFRLRDSVSFRNLARYVVWR
jgi:hypothetical protein